MLESVLISAYGVSTPTLTITFDVSMLTLDILAIVAFDDVISEFENELILA